MNKTLFTLLALSAATGAVAEPAVYKVDPTHTRAAWEAKHFGTSTNRGHWDTTEGEITLDKVGKIGKINIIIDMASINTGIASFNGHMKGPDFFDVDHYPTATFVGDKLTFEGDKITEVSGDLTIRGKTHPAVLKATSYNCYDNPRLKREVCGGDFETIVKRSAFNVNWGIAEKFTADDIKVTIQIEAIKM